MSKIVYTSAGRCIYRAEYDSAGAVSAALNRCICGNPCPCRSGRELTTASRLTTLQFEPLREIVGEH